MNQTFKNIKRYMYAIALVAGIVLNTSCEHKPLYVLDDNPRMVRLTFDWKNLRTGDAKPEGMHIVFCGEGSDGYAPLREFEVPTSTGLRTQLDPMDYVITGYSNDIPVVRVTQDKNDAVVRALEPGNDIPAIYAVNQKAFVENGSTEEGEDAEEQTIVAVPFPVNCIYTIKVENTDMEPDGKEWTATLSGLTNVIMLNSGKSADKAEELTRHTPLYTAVSNERKAVISILGRMDGKANELRIKVTRQNGTSALYKTDVTKQIDNASDFRNVLIVVNLKDCEKDTEDVNGSLNPAVDDFPNVDTDINL